MATPKQIRTRKAFSRPKLRERAEAVLSAAPARLDEAPAAREIHELHVYQAELEIRNKELRRIQLELEGSRDRFAQLYDQAPVGYLTLDRGGVVHEANLTAARLSGLDRQVLLKHQLFGVIAAESRNDLQIHLRQVFGTGLKQTCELQLRPTRAPAFTGRLESVLMRAEPGQPPRCLVALSDVTRHRQAELALQESQARLQGIVRLAMDAIILVNNRQRIVLFNEAAERMFGRAPGEVMGQPLDLLIPARFRPGHTAHIRRFGESDVASRPMSERGQIWGLRADGTEFPIEASISQIGVAGQKFYTVIVRDITKRLEGEKALRESEAALADFFGESPLGLLWVAADGRILRVNRALLEMVGRTDDEVLGHEITEFYADPEVGADTLRRLLGKETVMDSRARFRSRGGTIVHFLIDANGLWDHGRLVHTRWFVRDISWRLKLEREILKIGEREQQRLGQELHDDLCQQLSSIEYLSHSLAIDLSVKSKADAQRAKEIARLVREANARTRELSHGLSALPAGMGGLVGALKDLARRTTAVFQRDCRFHGLESVRIDEPEVRQHLYRFAQEAVGNAVKHGKATRIDIRLTRNGNRLILGVRDNGLGLPKKIGRRKGMGLRIMQYRAEMISGSMVVQREPDGGTTVVCSVPDTLVKPRERRKG